MLLHDDCWTHLLGFLNDRDKLAARAAWPNELVSPRRMWCRVLARSRKSCWRRGCGRRRLGYGGDYSCFCAEHSEAPRRSTVVVRAQHGHLWTGMVLSSNKIAVLEYKHSGEFVGVFVPVPALRDPPQNEAVAGLLTDAEDGEDAGV